MRINGGVIASWIGFNSDQDTAGIDEEKVDPKENHTEVTEDLDQIAEESEDVDQGSSHYCEQNCFHHEQQNFFSMLGQYCGFVSTAHTEEQVDTIDEEKVDQEEFRGDNSESYQDEVSTFEYTYTNDGSSYEDTQYGNGEEDV